MNATYPPRFNVSTKANEDFCDASIARVAAACKGMTPEQIARVQRLVDEEGLLMAIQATKVDREDAAKAGAPQELIDKWDKLIDRHLTAAMIRRVTQPIQPIL